MRTDKTIICNHQIHPHRIAEPKHNSSHDQNNVPPQATFSFVVQPLEVRLDLGQASLYA